MLHTHSLCSQPYTLKTKANGSARVLFGGETSRSESPRLRAGVPLHSVPEPCHSVTGECMAPFFRAVPLSSEKLQTHCRGNKSSGFSEEAANRARHSNGRTHTHSLHGMTMHLHFITRHTYPTVLTPYTHAPLAARLRPRKHPPSEPQVYANPGLTTEQHSDATF